MQKEARIESPQTPIPQPQKGEEMLPVLFALLTVSSYLVPS